MHPIEQRLPFFCQPFFCQIELRGWDVAASRNTKLTLAGNSIVQVGVFFVFFRGHFISAKERKDCNKAVQTPSC